MSNDLEKGWIKLHRKFIDWQWYTDINVKTLFLHLLLIANRKDNPWHNIIVKRSECITSTQNLAKETGLSEQQVRTVLKKLESSNEILRKSTNKYTHLTVCNYETYQGVVLDINKQITNEQQTNNKQVTTNKKLKKKDIYINKNKALSRREIIPPTFDMIREFISEQIVKDSKWKNVDFEGFFNHHETRGWLLGKGAKMKNWESALRTWKKNAEKWSKEGNNGYTKNGKSDNQKSGRPGGFGKSAN